MDKNALKSIKFEINCIRCSIKNLRLSNIDKIWIRVTDFMATLRLLQKTRKKLSAEDADRRRLFFTAKHAKSAKVLLTLCTHKYFLF